MPVQGRLEVTVRFHELPEAREVKNGWMAFEVHADTQVVTTKVRPRTWKKLLSASETFPEWVCVMSGKMGARTKHGFVLEQPGLQLFERKSKTPPEENASS